MVNLHGKTFEELEAELRSCRERIAELERTEASLRAAAPPSPSVVETAEHERLHADLEQQTLELHTFKTLADHALDGIGITGMDRKISYANAAYREMTGFGDRTIGTFTVDFLDESERDRLFREIRPTLASRRQWQGTLKFRRPDGSTWLAQGNIVMLHDETNVPFAYAAIYHDVTKDLLREEALRESEARHRALLDAIPDLMFLLDADGVFADYKAQRDGALSTHPDPLVGRRLEEAFPPALSAQIRAASEEVFRTRQTQNMEYSLLSSTGKHAFEARMVACGGHHVLVIARDITGQKRVEEEKIALQAQVISAQEATLRALATPVIPIADGIIAMPLIGAIDRVRADLILEVLLDGIASQNVRIAILDITGVKVIDAETANALVRAAQAARLLGARVVLTGISPKVAQTLVELNADMGGVVTRGTLKAGIAYALR
jgi:rsbT co-antagonist protein RsbR